MSWAIIVPLVMFVLGLAMVSIGWAMVEDDPAGALHLAKLREEFTADLASIAAFVARSDDFALELRGLGLARAAWMINTGPILSIVGVVLGVVSTAAVLTVG